MVDPVYRRDDEVDSLHMLESIVVFLSSLHRVVDVPLRSGSDVVLEAQAAKYILRESHWSSSCTVATMDSEIMRGLLLGLAPVLVGVRDVQRPRIEWCWRALWLACMCSQAIHLLETNTSTNTPRALSLDTLCLLRHNTAAAPCMSTTISSMLAKSSSASRPTATVLGTAFRVSL